jgi:MarR family multiple gene transcriptional regulator MgrA
VAKENRLGFQFKQIHDILEANMNRQLKSVDLTMSQFVVLKFLFERRDETVTLRDIERFLGLKHPTVIGIIRRMEGKGFLQSEKNAADGRCRTVSLTQKAFEVRKQMDESKQRVDQMLEKGLTEGEIDALGLLLGRIYRNLQEIQQESI